MAERRYGKATAVITAFWLLTSAAVLTLATADPNVAQAGCGGGSSSGSPSASSSSGGGGGGLPTSATTILPLPGGSSSGSASPSGSESGSPSESAADDDEIPTAQDQKCKSTITIAFRSGRAPKFKGKVGSPEAMCEKARNVTVKKVKRGRDARIGKAVTNAKGKYKVPARNGKGRFYAVVAKATVEDENGTTIKCQGAKSRTIRP